MAPWKWFAALNLRSATPRRIPSRYIDTEVPMPVSQQDRISLSLPETFQDLTKPHAIFRKSRREERVAWCPEPWGGPGFWSITKYDDIQTISKLPHVFSSDDRHGGITLPSVEMIANQRGIPLEQLQQTDSRFQQFEGGRSMIGMDPPE